MSALEVNPVTIEECLEMLKTQAEEIERLESLHVLKNQKITELSEEVERLTDKHERFVNAAREFHDYIIIHPVKAFDVPDEIYVPFNTALTESEDKG